MDTLGPVQNTGRGFEQITFLDYYKTPCVIQQSSLADAEAIWLGVSDADPQVMARDAASLGIKTNQSTGWVPYPIPQAVLLTTRMHLSKAEVEKLIPVLQHWLETGSLS